MHSQENRDMYGSASLGVFITVIYSAVVKEFYGTGHSNIVPYYFLGMCI